MKKLIRKWLEIDTDPKQAAPCQPTQGELRLMVGEAISEALMGKQDTPWCDFPNWSEVSNLLKRALEEAARETAITTVDSRVKATIGSETFVDEVIARINRKQLA